MKIAFCYEDVDPARGGCEMYIADLARRLAADGHEIHLFACSWNEKSLPEKTRYHRLPAPRGPRFLRPWRFAATCQQALKDAPGLVSIGFNKTWGQDILYPLGGLHSASAEHNINKHRGRTARALARVVKGIDLAHCSYTLLERRQYLGPARPLIVVNSNMVGRHFQEHLGIRANDVRVVRNAIDPNRFVEHDRPRRRLEWRARWGVRPDEIVVLFVAMNYQLKGLDPLLRAVRLLPESPPFRLLVAGHPQTGAWQAMARRLGITHRVNFLGHIEETRNCYFAADFLVHPTFYDPCSLVVLEALACGLPVITSRFNGAAELLNPPREGYVIGDPHDHGQLAACMTELLDQPRRSACAQAARRSAAQWTFEHHYRELLSVFVKAAARKQAA